MEVRSEQLAFHLKNNFLPLYLISGDETVLVQEAVDVLRTKAASQGFSQRETHIVEAQFDWNQLIQGSAQRSLFSETNKKIIECQCGTLNAAATAALKQYAEKPTTDCVWIVSCEQLGKADKAKVWFKTVLEKGVVIPIWRLEPARHLQWVRQRVQQLGLQMEPAALQVLSDYTQGNLLAAKQEIEQLSLLCDKQLITTQQVQQVLSDFSRSEVFEVVELWLQNDKKALYHALTRLQEVEPDAHLRLMGALVAEVRQLILLAERVKQGESLQELMQTYRVWPKRRPWVTQKLAQTPLVEWYQLVEKLTRVEYLQKGVERDGNVWQEITVFLLQLA